MFDYQMVTLEFVGDTTKNQDFVGLSETRMPPAPLWFTIIFPFDMANVGVYTSIFKETQILHVHISIASANDLTV